MKSNKFLKISLLLIFILFFVHLTDSILNYHDNYNFKGDSLESIRDLNNLKQSSYWTLSNIYINDNWSEIAINNDWCNFKNGYYIIENVSISGDVYAKNGIHIENSNESFIIRNCQINEGIALKEVQNGQFIDNNVTFGQAYLTGMVYQMGIYMVLCSNITVRNNIINDTFNTDYGKASAIYLYICDNITIFENFLSTNSLLTFGSSYGIHLSGDYMKVFNNTICDNDKGIYLSQYSFGKVVNNNIYNSLVGLQIKGDNHIIANNTIKNSYMYGIKAWCSNSTFSYNSIQNENEYGFYFYEGNYNIISNNNIQDSKKYGIYLESSNHSFITGNLISFKIGCIKEINCYGNIIRYNVCQKVPSPIGGYYPWMVLGILIITMSIILKIKLKDYN